MDDDEPPCFHSVLFDWQCADAPDTKCPTDTIEPSVTPDTKTCPDTSTTFDVKSWHVVLAILVSGLAVLGSVSPFCCFQIMQLEKDAIDMRKQTSKLRCQLRKEQEKDKALTQCSSDLDKCNKQLQEALEPQFATPKTVGILITLDMIMDMSC